MVQMLLQQNILFLQINNGVPGIISLVQVRELKQMAIK